MPQKLQTNEPVAFSQVLAAIKRILKQKKITYGELALKLHISESTLKKMFVANDWSYSRLAEVCEVLGLELAALLTAVKERRVLDIRFTAKQEALFMAEPRVFTVYWLLVYERLAAREAQKHLSLGESEFFRMLRVLDTHGLLELHADNTVKIPAVQPVQWSGKSPFLAGIKRRWAKKTIDDAIEGDPENGDQFCLQYFQLHPASFEKLRLSLQAIEEEFARLTARDMVLHEKNLVRFRYSMAMANGSFMRE